MFVGPDNGIFSLPLHAQVYQITNSSLFQHPVSRTFHGRDIFAPVAAHLACGTPLESVGPRIIDVLRKTPSRRAQILRIDKFGNIITNVRREHLKKDFAIRIGGVEIRRLLSNYDEAQPGEIFAIEGSAGYLELALKQGSAAQTLRVGRGAEIEVETDASNQ
jgi:S-adenosyl-L-methionine hydrolase (adenosine-forming)